MLFILFEYDLYLKEKKLKLSKVFFYVNFYLFEIRLGSRYCIVFFEVFFLIKVFYV